MDCTRSLRITPHSVPVGITGMNYSDPSLCLLFFSIVVFRVEDMIVV